MIAGKRGYRDIINFSDDNKMLSDYFGLIARGERFFLSHFRNVNEGRYIIEEISFARAQRIIKAYAENGLMEAYEVAFE